MAIGTVAIVSMPFPAAGRLATAGLTEANFWRPVNLGKFP